MVAPNRLYLAPRSAAHGNSQKHALAERLGHYFDQHPNVSREDFLLGALQREIDARQPLAVGDTRIHAWLLARQAIVDRDRRSLRAKAKRLFQW